MTTDAKKSDNFKNVIAKDTKIQYIYRDKNPAIKIYFM